MDEFDKAALSLVEKSLEIERFDVDNAPFERKYIVALHLQKVYGFTPGDLIEYLEENTNLRKKIGLQDNIHPSTIHRKETQLEEDHPAKLKSIRQASKRTVWNLSVQDINIPTQTRSAHQLTESDISELSIPRSLEQEETQRWVENLLDVLDPLTFNQSGTSIDKFVGLCAHFAVQGIAPGGADDTVDYLYNGEEIPSGRTLLEYIRQIERGGVDNYPANIISQFSECFDNFIDLVTELGFYQESQQLAADTTPIPTTSTKTEQTVGGSGSRRSPADHGKRSFRFQFLSTVGSNSNFVLSVEPYSEKTKIPDRLGNQLQRAVSHPRLDIDHVTCDKDYYNKEIFKILDIHGTNNWVVCAKRKGEIKQLISQAKDGNEKNKRGLAIGQPPRKPMPNAFCYPLSDDIQYNKSDDQKSLTAFNSESDTTVEDETTWEQFTDEDPTHPMIAYVTDAELTNENMRKLHVCYRNRREIEPIIGQIRDNYLPYTESVKLSVRCYFMSIATIFRNFNHLINISPSPECGVPLNVTAKEWLSAIRNATLSE